MAYLGWTTAHRGAGPGFYLHGRVRDAMQRPGPGDQQRGARSSLADGQGREEDTLPEGDGDKCLQRWRSSWSRFGCSSSTWNGQRVQPAGQHSGLFTTAVGTRCWTSATGEPSESRQRPSGGIQSGSRYIILEPTTSSTNLFGSFLQGSKLISIETDSFGKDEAPTRAFSTR